MTYTLHRQRDDRWKFLTLGYNTPGSKYTIGNYGCLLTCLASACGTTPDKLNETGKAHGLFAAGTGLALTFDTRRWITDPPYTLVDASERFPNSPFPQVQYDAVVENVNDGGLSILEVQWPGTRSPHFVLCIAAPAASHREMLIIADPERHGPVEELREFYGDWQIAIVRAVHFARGMSHNLIALPEIANTYHVLSEPEVIE